MFVSGYMFLILTFNFIAYLILIRNFGLANKGVNLFCLLHNILCHVVFWLYVNVLSVFLLLIKVIFAQTSPLYIKYNLNMNKITRSFILVYFLYLNKKNNISSEIHLTSSGKSRVFCTCAKSILTYKSLKIIIKSM